MLDDKKWQKASRQTAENDPKARLGLLVKDFNHSEFEDEFLSDEEIAGLFNHKSRLKDAEAEFESQLAADLELDGKAKDDLRYDFKERQLMEQSSETFIDALSVIMFQLDKIAKNIDDDLTKLQIERSMAGLQQLIVALYAWQTYTTKEQQITYFGGHDVDAKELKWQKSFSKTAKEGIAKTDVVKKSTESWLGLSLLLALEAETIAKNEKLLQQEIPIIVDAPEILKKGGETMEMIKACITDDEGKNYITLMEKALANMAQGYEELEIKKRFNDYEATREKF